MGELFREGELRIRPGISYRFSDRGDKSRNGTNDGINAFIMKADWGPVGEVVALKSAESAEETYGPGAGTDMVKAIFAGGANTVFVYRTKSDSDKCGTGILGALNVTAKYPGSYPITVDVQPIPNTTEKELIIITGTTIKQKIKLPSQLEAGVTEAHFFMEQINKKSAYVTAELKSETGGAVAGRAVLSGANGNPVNGEYDNGFYALAPYQYGYICVDRDDDDVAVLLAKYVAEANNEGKLIVGVTAATEEDFEDRLDTAKAINSASMICLGNGYIDFEGNDIKGAKAVAYTAGLVSSTPSSKSIVHSVVPAAEDVNEKLTNAQYEAAIQNGLLLLSVSADGQVWYDSGINTLIEPSELQDDGWKKIKRVKVRNEIMDRIDRILATKIGRVSCDKDGIADVLQGGIGVINSMVSEGKLFAGSTMYLDPNSAPEADSTWFILDIDDVDSLEKIYLHYQFRYSQNV